MMNKILSIALLFSSALSFTACVDEEADLFDKSAAERLNEASELYSERLTASPNGWAVQLYPTTKDEAPYGNGYLLMFRFHKDKSVDASMNNSLSGGKYMTDTSAWDVITDNGPVLSFNTYNTVVHTFSNPEDVASTGNKENPNDETGTGIGGDYEFIIVDAPEDASYMMLKGKKRGTYNLLTPVEEGVDFESYLADVKAFQNKMFSTSSPSSDYLHRGDKVYVFDDGNTGVPAIYPWGQDKVMASGFNPFLITKRGDDYYLRFRDAFQDDDITVQDFKYIPEKDIFQSVDNENYYICGDTASNFFDKSISTKREWRITTSSSMSETVKSQIQKISTAFKKINKSYTFKYFALKGGNADNTIVLSCYYGNSNAAFNYSYKIEGDVCTLTYTGCNAAAQNILNAIPDLSDFINMLSQSFELNGGETNFDMSEIKVSSTSDSNLWFNVVLK